MTFKINRFKSVALAGALAIGGVTLMNLETPKTHADENCRYICGPSETLNNFTIQ